MINYEDFKCIENAFIKRSCSKYSFLKRYLNDTNVTENDVCVIKKYFQNLLGEHYVDQNFG